MVELLKQGQYVPMPVEEQVASIWAGTSGHLDDIPVGKISEFEKAFLAFLVSHRKKMLSVIAKEKVISEVTEKELQESIAEFKKTFKSKT